ncbi:interferon-induced GTP-binding protein Mx2 [Xylaria sp. CBS 124048]|nr:interferon-induced GTP-binding protein Mx2 [Xylaria sp. CBS 124048]
MKLEDMNGPAGQGQPTPGNSSILTKVDKLRELIGTRVALPQLVVVGDQSSGKSSVLENLTGFAFPRDAELCTRYATQITCRREAAENIAVTIMASPEAAPEEHERLKKFRRGCTELSPESLAQIFKDANEAMGISTSNKKTDSSGIQLPAFSQHMLKIEKLGPQEEHFTVIDVPGIFRQETTGVTTESDIELVRNMVKKHSKSQSTCILAIIPCNVDPATQEILKLAKKADPTMTRTMAVLTKPDLAIEQVNQRIVIDHVLGKRGDLTLGYYVVKNRGPDPDDAIKTLAHGQADEREFFTRHPWSELAHTGKTGIVCLKQRVRELLTDLIKKEFPKLKSEVAKELNSIKENHAAMGASRSDPQSQRAYLSKMSEAFQSLARDALNAYYVGNKIFSDRHDLRLITRIVKQCENYASDMIINGHTRPFQNSDREGDGAGTLDPKATTATPTPSVDEMIQKYPELDTIVVSQDDFEHDSVDKDIMAYIDEVYKASRSQELGNSGNGLLATLFKEQSRNWEGITLWHVSVITCHIHHFISEAVRLVCPDQKVQDELWNGYLLEELMASYRRAMDHARFLLKIEREGPPLTLNNSFGRFGQKLRTDRMIKEMRQLSAADVTKNSGTDDGHIDIKPSQLENLTSNKKNDALIGEEKHDDLSSYYAIARDRFVDVIYQQAVNYHLLFGEKSPLNMFNTNMVMGLNEEQLDMIAAEDALVKQRREKLNLDIANFEEALKVLKGSR